jgi:type I restriction enzyme, S subunit
MSHKSYLQLWRPGKLKDLVFFQRGFDITKAEQKEGVYPVISSSGVNSFHSKYMVEGPGIVIGRKGTLGSVHFAAGNYWPHDTTLWSKDLKGNDPKYVFYFLKTLGLERHDVGSSNPTLNRNHIHELAIKIPPFTIQRRIASILSAYDDLIENNRRRITLLEKAARLLYEEWFIRLQFPGYEQTPIVAGVPEGWERKPLSMLADFVNGYPFKPNELFDDGLPVVKIPELRDGVRPSTPRNDGSNMQKKYFINNEDLLFSWSGTLLVSFWFGGPAILNQHLFNVTPFPSTVSKPFMCLALQHKLEELESLSIGATMKHIRKSTLNQVEVLVPNKAIKVKFDSKAVPLFQQIGNLLTQNQKLQTARDLLLPRLLSGELEVSSLSQSIPELVS